MQKLRQKQKRLKKIMKGFVIATAVLLFIYIGVQPTLAELSTSAALLAFNYFCDILVIVSLALVLVYYSKYSKAEMFFNDVEGEISDCGYYYTARQEKDISSYYEAVCNDLNNSGFNLEYNLELTELEFDARALKAKEFIYIVNIEKLDKNDVIAYLDSAVYDVTAVNLKRKGNCVVLFLCDEASEGAISLSKAVTSMGRKNQLKFTIAIAEVKTSKVYFAGLNPTKCQQMIANYVLNCALPIKEQYKGKEKLSFQYELEEKMKSFNLKDFKDGTFSVH